MAQQWFCRALEGVFSKNRLEIRTVGVQDFGVDSPLAQVLEIMKTCDGACILGMEQVRCTEVVMKPGTKYQRAVTDVAFATPWNQLEAGMALILGLPLFVICEEGITEGIFDDGVGDVFCHRLPTKGREKWLTSPSFVQPLAKWIRRMDEAPPRRGTMRGER